MSHAASIRAAFDRLRPHIRPEADHLAGSLATAIDQAEAAEADPSPAAPEPIGVQLDQLIEEVTATRAAVVALTEAVGI